MTIGRPIADSGAAKAPRRAHATDWGYTSRCFLLTLPRVEIQSEAR
jgi:hypothetical protein